MAYTVYIPPKLLKLSVGQQTIKLSEALTNDSLLDALNRLEEECPGIKLRICPRDKLRQGVAIYVNSRNVKDLTAPLPESAEIAILA